MKKPLCKVCGNRHYASEPHDLLDEKSKRMARMLDRIPIAKKPALLASQQRSSQVIRMGGFDRVAYMREYMKVRRAIKAQRACAWPKGSETI